MATAVNSAAGQVSRMVYIRKFLKNLFHHTEMISKGPSEFAFKLTPVYPDPTQLGGLDENVKIMAGIVDAQLNKNIPNAKNFTDIQGFFNGTALQVIIHLNNNHSVNISELFSTQENPSVDLRKGPSSATIESLKAWIETNIIKDHRLLKISGLDDPKVIQELLSFSREGIESQLRLNIQQEGNEILNLGILEYPQPESPYVKLHRVQLSVWVKEKLAHQSVKDRETGLRASFNTYAYEPSDTMNTAVQGDTKTLALKRFEELVQTASRAEYATTSTRPTAPVAQTL